MKLLELRESKVCAKGREKWRYINMSADVVKWDEPIIDGIRWRWKTTLKDGALD